jgi:hypothetical protein
MAMPIRGGGHAPRNDFQTRDVELVIAAIAHLLPPGVHIWEPFAGTAARRLSTGLEEAGYAVSCTGLPEQDFFATEPPPGVTMVVTNPPSEGYPLTLCVLARRARFLTSDGAIIRGAPMGCAWFCKLPDTVGGFVFPPY